MTDAAKTIITPPQVQPTEAQQALAEIGDIVRRAELVTVSNADEYEAAVGLCRRIATQTKKRTDERMVITRAMDAAKKTVLDFFETNYLAPLTRVDTIIRGKLKAYDAEQKRLADQRRAEAEAKAKREREEAERKAREEREKAEANARRAREEAERQRQEQERARREADEAKQRGDAEAARIAREREETAARAAQKSESKAERIEAKGEEKVEALTLQAASIVAPLVEVSRPKVKGNTRRTVWKWKLKDAAKVNRLFLAIDESKIGKQVKTLHKDAEDIVGGIEVWEEEDLSIHAEKT